MWFLTYYTLIQIRPQLGFFCRHVWFLSYYTFYSDQATVCILSSRVVPDISHILFRSGRGLNFVGTCGYCHITHFIQIRPHFASCRHVWFLSYCTYYRDQAIACFLSSRVVPDIVHSYLDQATACFFAVTCGSCHIANFIQIRPWFAFCRHVWFLSYYTFYSDQATVCFLSRLFIVILHYFIRIRPQIESCRHVWFLPNYTCYSEQTTVYFLVVMLVYRSHSPFLNLMNKSDN